mgnify:CR=1 FL=1
MILNIFSLRITITKREKSLEEEIHNENVKKIYEENRRKIEDYIGPRQF